MRNAALVMFLIVLLFCPRLQAQVGASASKPASLFIYGLASAPQHEQGYGRALGGTAGILVHHNRWLAVDLRGVALRERIPLHTYLGEAGPRVSQSCGPLHFYLEGLAGLGRSGYKVPSRHLDVGYGAAWTSNAGVDLHVTTKLGWRVAEYSYNHIYVGTGAKSSIISTGLVYRFF